MATLGRVCVKQDTLADLRTDQGSASGWKHDNIIMDVWDWFSSLSVDERVAACAVGDVAFIKLFVFLHLKERRRDELSARGKRFPARGTFRLESIDDLYQRLSRKPMTPQKKALAAHAGTATASMEKGPSSKGNSGSGSGLTTTQRDPSKSPELAGVIVSDAIEEAKSNLRQGQGATKRLTGGGPSRDDSFPDPHTRSISDTTLLGDEEEDDRDDDWSVSTNNSLQLSLNVEDANDNNVVAHATGTKLLQEVRLVNISGTINAYFACETAFDVMTLSKKLAANPDHVGVRAHTHLRCCFVLSLLCASSVLVSVPPDVVVVIFVVATIDCAATMWLVRACVPCCIRCSSS